MDYNKNEMIVLLALARENAAEDAKLFFRLKFDGNHEIEETLSSSPFNKQVELLDCHSKTNGISFSRYITDFVRIDEDKAIC